MRSFEGEAVLPSSICSSRHQQLACSPWSRRSPVPWWCTSSTRWATPSSRSRVRRRPASYRGTLAPEPQRKAQHTPHHAHHSTAWPTSQLALPITSAYHLRYASARAAKLMAEVQASAIRPGCASLTFVAATERSLRSLFDGVHARPAEAFEPEGSAERDSWCKRGDHVRPRGHTTLPVGKQEGNDTACLPASFLLA